MTWREDLRRVSIGGRNLVGASFRGVPFFVDSSERGGGGRRIVTHEFPGRDDPFVEDLGRGARTFRIEGYVIGDDYLSQRDALLSALEDQEGPGTLLHPYYGVRSVICMPGLTVRESKSDGGMATFGIEFAETPTQAPTPTEVADPAGQVAASADTASQAASDELVEQYDTALPSYATASAVSAVTKAVDAVQSALDQAFSSVVGLGKLASSVTTQELAALTGELSLLTLEASSLVRTPATLLSQFSDAVTGLVQTAAAAPEAVMDAYLTAYAADLGPPVVATTATRALELANQTALTSALRRVLLLEAARLAPTVPFATVDDAIAARDQLLGLLDEQAELAGDTAYPALVDLRSQVLRAVPGSSTFARVVTVTRPIAVPSIVLAYQLYGSVDLELDIVARNGIQHPGFVVGDVKVLSDG